MPRSELLQLDPDSPEFTAWLKRRGFRKPRASVLHHCFVPNAKQYQGRETIRAIETYHIQARGFSTIAANAYTCPDGTIITGRNLSYGNWAHALVSRGQRRDGTIDWSKVEAEARAICGGDKQWMNHNAFGVETVANFDVEPPTGTGKAAKSYETAMRVLTVVHRTFGIPASRLFFHRDVSDKSCPGRMLSRTMVRAELARRLGEAAHRDIKIIDQRAPGLGLVIECGAELRNDGRVWVQRHALLNGLDGDSESTGGLMYPIRDALKGTGLTPVPHLEQGKVYIVQAP